MSEFKNSIFIGIPESLPDYKKRSEDISHAPNRKDSLTNNEKALALKNALRYFPKNQHNILGPEFKEELEFYGRIYMYRYQPDYEIYARPIDQYPGRSVQAKSIMLMINNNLDPSVAQHPQELITYGGNGSVFQNWAQYLLTMQYLSNMEDDQTLVINSGHPLGLFPSNENAPRVVVSNGMMIPNYSKQDDLENDRVAGSPSPCVFKLSCCLYLDNFISPCPWGPSFAPASVHYFF